MAEMSRSQKKLKQTLTLTLAAPVVMCFVIGVVFLVSGDKDGYMLLALTAVLGAFNFLIVKFVFARAEKMDQE